MAKATRHGQSAAHGGRAVMAGRTRLKQLFINRGDMLSNTHWLVRSGAATGALLRQRDGHGSGIRLDFRGALLLLESSVTPNPTGLSAMSEWPGWACVCRSIPHRPSETHRRGRVHIPPGTRLRKPARQAGRGLLCSNYRGERVLGVRVRIRGVFPKLSSDKGEECVSWPGDAIVAVRRKSGLSVASSLFAGRSFSPADFGDIFAAIESVSRIKKWRSTCCFSRSRKRLYRRIIRTRRSDTSRHHRKFFLYLSSIAQLFRVSCFSSSWEGRA
jgi:hypothetical protein